MFKIKEQTNDLIKINEEYYDHNSKEALKSITRKYEIIQYRIIITEKTENHSAFRKVIKNEYGNNNKQFQQVIKKYTKQIPPKYNIETEILLMKKPHHKYHSKEPEIQKKYYLQKNNKDKNLIQVKDKETNETIKTINLTELNKEINKSITEMTTEDLEEMLLQIQFKKGVMKQW